MDTSLTSLTVPSLVARGTGAHPGRGAIPPVHALRVAQRGTTMLPHVSVRALANLFVVTPTLIRAFFVALWIRPWNNYVS